MSLFWSIVIVIGCASVGIAAMLLARRRAPEGSHFQDGDRASGVFGVLATGFALLLGLVVILAFDSYDQSRSGAETEALIVAQQFETAQLMPPESRDDLSGELICYARSVVNVEWPRMEQGTQGTRLNVWGAELFKTLRTIEPETNAEQAVYGTWLDQTAAREAARNDRIHGAVGVIPAPLWLVLLLSSGVIFGYMLLFADSAEHHIVQAVMMGSLVTVMASSLVLIGILDQPFHQGFGGLQPTAMERTEQILREEQVVAGEKAPLPCGLDGRPKN